MQNEATPPQKHAYPKVDVDALGEYWRLRAKTDLAIFTEQLGYKNAPFHLEWYRFLQPKDDDKHFSPLEMHPHACKKYHIEAPRKHAKSECIAINYPSWLIGNYQDIHITIVSKTASLAEQTVAAIKTRLESNTDYRRIFGDLKPETPQKWTSDELIVKRPTISKFPTLYATGLHGPLTGGGNDLIIADDIIDEEDVTTPHSMEKASTWFYKVLLTTLFPWGAVLVIGTRWHYADLYTQLLREWPHQVLRAMNVDEKGRETGTVLWPEVWSYEKLCQRRKDIGSIFFGCQYQNDPTHMEGDLLKAEWLHPWNEQGLSQPNFNGVSYFAGIDPSLGESDYFGIATVAYDPSTGQVYLVDVWAEHMPFPEILKEKLPLMHGLYKYQKIYMETNFWQKILTFLPEMKEFPIVPIRTVKNKEERFIPMSSHFESKRVLVNPLIGNRSEFWNEWVQFPRGEHDDALDAVELVLHNIMNLGPLEVGSMSVPW